MKKLPLQKNEHYDIEITDMTDDGQGLGRAQGMVVFVPGAFAGETVRTKIVKVRSTSAFGLLEEVLVASNHRIEPRCPAEKQCGGCQFQRLDYAGELDYKQKKVESALQRIGGVSCPVSPILGACETEHYRNKGQFPVGSGPDGKAICGLYAGRSHRIIPMTSCLIQEDASKHILRAVLNVMERYQIPPYDEASHTGCIRHVYTRVSHKTGEVMAVIVTRTKELPHAVDFVDELHALKYSVVSVIHNVNPEQTNVVLGKTSTLLYGQDFITDEISGLSFQISHRSFFQVNPSQTQKLYQTALDFAGLTKDETVFDLYCGIGTITLLLAQAAKKAYGIEIVAQAVDNARNNAQLNQINNAEFYCGDSFEATDKLLKKGIHPDVIVVDPPRAGLSDDLVRTILHAAPQRLVYVSCDVGTLARDLKRLEAEGYQTRRVQPVDMFPRTKHVETVVLLSK